MFDIIHSSLQHGILTEEKQNHQDPCINDPEALPTGQLAAIVNDLHGPVCSESDWSTNIYPAAVCCSTSDCSTDILPTPGTLSTSSNLKPDLCRTGVLMSFKLQLVQHRRLCLWKIIANWQQELRVSLLPKHTHSYFNICTAVPTILMSSSI